MERIISGRGEEMSSSIVYNPHAEELVFEASVNVLSSLRNLPEDIRNEITTERRINARSNAEQLEYRIADSRRIERLKIDSLTGLPGREVFEEEFPSIFSRKQAGSLAVMYIDIRGLKLMNNQLNHGYGDTYLRKTSEFITESIRTTDRVYRVGGDEFVAVTDFDETEKSLGLDGLLDRVRNSIESKIQLDPELPKNLSLGVYIGGAIKSQDDTPDTMLARADKQCVEAKQQYDQTA